MVKSYLQNIFFQITSEPHQNASLYMLTCFSPSAQHDRAYNIMPLNQFAMPCSSTSAIQHPGP
jgi:hypothetical protein